MKRIYLTFVFAGAVCFQVAAQNADEDRILSADSLITMDGRLDSLYRSLPEVMVVGERPVVKAMQGKLVYDLPRLIQNFAV
ncbi:MAG: signal protein, partial [Bacteroides fragilis]